MIKIKFPLIFLIGFVLSFKVISQEKRIISKYVSEEIKHFIAVNYPSLQKVKFYQEKQNDSIFIEAEFHIGKDEISLKFYQNQWTEKETELDFEEITEQVKANINTFLRTEFTKHKIRECYLVESPKKKNQYEIYVKGTYNKKSNLYEIYFDEKGNFIHSEVIETAPIQSLY